MILKLYWIKYVEVFVVRVFIGLTLMIFITGCVLINGSVSHNGINATASSTGAEIPQPVKESCSLSDYKYLITVPEIPALDKDRKDDQEYTDAFLTNVINEHRVILKELKKELDRCLELKYQ